MRPATISEDTLHRLQAQLARILPTELVGDLVGHHTTVTYAKESALFLQGAPADLMFWILSGVVRVYCPMPDGNRTLVRVCGPGEIVGYVDFMGSNGQRSQAFEAWTLTKCTAVLLTRERMFRMLQKLDQPELIRLLEQLNTAWSSFGYRFASLLGASFRQRLELTLKDLAARFGVEDKRGILLPMKLSHSDIAEMINGSRPMVTRLIGEMIAEQSLYRDGKLYIVSNSFLKNGNGAKPEPTRLVRDSAKPNGSSIRNGTSRETTRTTRQASEKAWRIDVSQSRQ